MGLFCPRCQKELYFSGDPPSFCGYCREPLPHVADSSNAGDSTAVSTAQREPAPDRAPNVVGEYRLGVRLGAGGMGSVYEAIHTQTGRHVAIKLLAPRLSGDPQLMERFRQEGRLAGQINHPRCVFVYAADEDEGRPYIVMEMMPGTTLEDQVKGQGGLPVREAIERTLEVIDGLQAAHRLGVLHRDVKPSNCFLLDDGTVKVGDFGLSKLLAQPEQFSEPGAFKGTVTYAPPEQLRNEPLDFAADVYSVTATLFFLLTGQAPFDGDSLVTAVARAASERPPDVRGFRPDVPRSLARVIRMGLEPDRTQRIASLDDLRQRLLDQIPGRLTAPGLGLRIGAFLIDEAVLSVRFLVPWKMIWAWSTFPDSLALATWVALSVMYFAILEAIWGCSLGKLILRLRVFRLDSFEPPDLRQSLVRSSVFSLAYIVPTIGVQFLPSDAPRDWILGLAVLAGLFAMAWPMRPKNGFRGVHELASGTRVVQRPWPEPPPVYPRRNTVVSDERPVEFPDRLGQYALDRIVGHPTQGILLLANDPLLQRSVVILLHSGTEGVSPERRELARPTRLRWLSCGSWSGRAWDAFTWMSPMSAADLVTPNEPLAWAEARPILEQLTRELLESVREHSTPAVLSPEQIRVGNDGAVQLLDWSLRPITPAVSPTPLQFVQHMAILLLEGRPPAPGELHRSIRAPIPAHAVPMLDRLMGVRDPGPSLESFAAALEATRDRPRRVTFVQKLAYLWVFAVLHALGLLFMFTPRFLLESVSGADPTRITRVAAYLWDIQSTGPQTRLVAVGTSLSMPVVFWPAAWAIWAAIFRGGFAYQFTGLRLVRQDGRPASRLQCAFRVLIVWAPISLLLLANLLLTSIAAPTDIADIAWWVAGGLLVVFAELSLVYPRRSLHDWLAGTWLVPE